MTARQQIRVVRLGRERSPIDAQPAPTVGEMLQAARERRGVDLYRAERDTKIRARHLAALESGDYSELPGSVYTKGFLRNYALYLALDPEELLTRWRDEQDFGRRGEPMDVTPPPQPISEPRRGFTFTPGLLIAAVLSIVVVLFAGYVGLQLVRFSQVPALTLDGDRVVRLAEDATTVTLRGTAGALAIIDIMGPDAKVLQTSSADDKGAWITELGVSKGRNDFTIVAHDPDTGRESSPLEATVIVSAPVTATPDATTRPGESAAPGGTGATQAPGQSGTGTVAALAVEAPADGASIENQLLDVRGTSDDVSVTVEAIWAGDGAKPKGPGAQTLKVKDGAFEGTVPLPEGRWSVQITTAGANGRASASATRTVDVSQTGLFVTVEAKGGGSWVRVWVDGEIAEQGHTFKKGETAAYSAKRSVVISSGDAGATYVVVNGVPYGALGEAGKVATIQFDKGKDPRPLN